MEGAYDFMDFTERLPKSLRLHGVLFIVGPETCQGCFGRVLFEKRKRFGDVSGSSGWQAAALRLRLGSQSYLICR